MTLDKYDEQAAEMVVVIPASLGEPGFRGVVHIGPLGDKTGMRGWALRVRHDTETDAERCAIDLKEYIASALRAAAVAAGPKCDCGRIAHGRHHMNCPAAGAPSC